jgi:hypothetical protein
MKVCPRCGHHNLDSSLVCSSCSQIFQARPPRLAQTAPQPKPFGTGSMAQPLASAPMCLVCGNALAPSVGSACPKCNVQIGYVADPSDGFCNRYVLPQNMSRTSVHMANLLTAQPEPSLLKERIPGWNWAAAFNSLFWTAKYRVWGVFVLCLLNTMFWAIITLGSLLPDPGGNPDTGTMAAAEVIGNILLLSSALFWAAKTLLLGRFGNTLAMRSGRYEDAESMLEHQRSTGLKQAILGMLVLVVIIVLLFRAGI